MVASLPPSDLALFSSVAILTHPPCPACAGVGWGESLVWSQRPFDWLGLGLGEEVARPAVEHTTR